ncbi:MAG: hypothetical protein K8S98_03255 [Planctomycetes bacterium]|nr:hypothetical protein [Planctomycetota bacterium]
MCLPTPCNVMWVFGSAAARALFERCAVELSRDFQHSLQAAFFPGPRYGVVRVDDADSPATSLYIIEFVEPDESK